MYDLVKITNTRHINWLQKMIKKEKKKNTRRHWRKEKKNE